MPESIVDGPGFRYAVFTQGCFLNCPGCHNPETHDPDKGTAMDTEDIVKDILKCRNIDGVTFSGGEPFLQAEACAGIAEKIPGRLNIICYTGYQFEDILKSQDLNRLKLLNCVNVLIDGPYMPSERDLSLAFRGSRNQRVIDVRQSLRTGETCLYNGFK